MGKNTKGGNKAKKMKNTSAKVEKVIYPDNEQYYAVVDKFNSHSSIFVSYIDEDETGAKKEVNANGVIRGKLIRRMRGITPGMLLIISKRDFESASKERPTVDILHKYTDSETRQVLYYVPNELKAKYNLGKSNNDDKDGISFSDNYKEYLNDDEREEIENEELVPQQAYNDLDEMTGYDDEEAAEMAEIARLARLKAKGSKL